MTPEQVGTCKAIVRVFETSRAAGNYAALAAVKGDRGGVSFGVCQASRASGNLFELVRAYRNAQGVHAAELCRWLTALQARNPSLDGDLKFHAALVRAAKDPIMRAVQERFYEERFWQPACAAAARVGLVLPLSLAVMLDSTVHGSRDRMIEATEQTGISMKVHGERAWVLRYCATRRAWLWGKGGLLRKTVYRMDAFVELIALDRWELPLPLAVPGRRVTITAADLAPVGAAG